MRGMLLGILASFFFAATFVLNRSMELAGGSWLWSASLRFLFMLPFLLAFVMARGKLGPLLQEMKSHPGKWFLWSLIGFGFFYAPLCYAAAYAPGWLVAGTFQVVVIAGILLSPFFYETVMTSKGKVQVKSGFQGKALVLSLVILTGVILMQWEHAKGLDAKDALLGTLPVLVAAFAYPLGNRKMMEVCGERLDTFQRVLGMTVASLPLWLGLAILAWVDGGPPSSSQLTQSFFVALFSGVIATLLFFRATEMVKNNQRKLAAVEATQSGELIFAVGGERVWLQTPLPTPVSWLGMVLIVGGMVLHSTVNRKKSAATVSGS